MGLRDCCIVFRTPGRSPQSSAMAAQLQAAEQRLKATEAKLKEAERRAADREKLTTFVTGQTSPKPESASPAEGQPRKREAVTRPAPTHEEEERLRLIAEQKAKQEAFADRQIQEHDERKQRRQALAIQAKEEREAKELEECNFAPTIKSQVGPGKQQKTRNGKPVVRAKPRMTAEKIENKLHKLHDLKKVNLAAARKIKEQKELEGLFSPTLSTGKKARPRTRSETAESVDRLSRGAVSQRQRLEERQQRHKLEQEKKIAEEVSASLHKKKSRLSSGAMEESVSRLYGHGKKREEAAAAAVAADARAFELRAKSAPRAARVCASPASIPASRLFHLPWRCNLPRARAHDGGFRAHY